MTTQHRNTAEMCSTDHAFGTLSLETDAILCGSLADDRHRRVLDVRTHGIALAHDETRCETFASDSVRTGLRQGSSRKPCSESTSTSKKSAKSKKSKRSQKGNSKSNSNRKSESNMKSNSERTRTRKNTIIGNSNRNRELKSKMKSNQQTEREREREREREKEKEKEKQKETDKEIMKD